MNASTRRHSLAALICCFAGFGAHAQNALQPARAAPTFNVVHSGYEATLIIAGNGNEVRRRVFTAGDTPAVAPGTLADGPWRYELINTPVDASANANATGVKPYASGTLLVRDGRIVPATPVQAAAKTGPNRATNTGGNHFVGSVTMNDNVCLGGPDCTDGLAVPEDLVILDTQANLWLTSTGPDQTWEIDSNFSSGAFEINDISRGGEIIFSLETTASANSFFAGSGEIGLFTATPEDGIELTLSQTTADVVDFRMETLNQPWDLSVNANGADEFALHDPLADTYPLQVASGSPTGTLVMDGSGNVGIGTEMPAKKAHIVGNDASGGAGNNSMLLIENNSAVPATRKMLELSNFGSPTMSYVDTATGNVWTLNPIGSSFTMSRVGTGGKELTVTRLGELQMRSNGALTFDLDKNGNLELAGALTQNSDVNAKEDFTSLERNDVLDRIAELPITEWKYKQDESARHIGPMAQDFHAAFGLGDDAHRISPMDAAGVALVAVQALNDELARKDAAIRALEERLARLETSMAAAQ